MRHIAPRHILELTLEVILEHLLGIKTMTSLILDHIATAYLYLVRRERYNLDIVKDQDYISLDIVIRLIKT